MRCAALHLPFSAAFYRQRAVLASPQAAPMRPLRPGCGLQECDVNLLSGGLFVLGGQKTSRFNVLWVAASGIRLSKAGKRQSSLAANKPPRYGCKSLACQGTFPAREVNH